MCCVSEAVLISVLPRQWIPRCHLQDGKTFSDHMCGTDRVHSALAGSLQADLLSRVAVQPCHCGYGYATPGRPRVAVCGQGQAGADLKRPGTLTLL